MKDLKLQLQIDNIGNALDEFIDSEAFHYNECYPLIFDEPICEGLFRSYGHELLIKRLNKDFGEYIDEILIALSICAATNGTAKKALDQVDRLKGLEVHSTVILSRVDEQTFKKLGVNLTCEPQYQTKKLYHA